MHPDEVVIIDEVDNLLIERELQINLTVGDTKKAQQKIIVLGLTATAKAEMSDCER